MFTTIFLWLLSCNYAFPRLFEKRFGWVKASVEGRSPKPETKMFWMARALTSPVHKCFVKCKIIRSNYTTITVFLSNHMIVHFLWSAMLAFIVSVMHFLFVYAIQIHCPHFHYLCWLSFFFSFSYEFFFLFGWQQ